MTTSDGGKYDGGFHLVEMVQAQRGLSDLEIEIFLATGQKPDLSLPPLEEQEDLDDGDRPVIAADAARAWLGGEPLTADAFYDFDPHHEVSPHYDALVASGVAFKFNPKQPRDDDGRWTDGFPGVDTPDFKSPSGKSGKSTLGVGTKKSTPAIIYKKHDDGATIAQSKTGDKRMRWDGGRKKFVVEQNKNGDWVEEAAHTKSAAYNDMKEPDKWFEPVETGTEGEIPNSSQTPEPDPVDTEPTANVSDVDETDTEVPPNADVVPPEADVEPTSTASVLGMSETDARMFVADWAKNVGMASNDLTNDERQLLIDWAAPGENESMLSMRKKLHSGTELTPDEIALRDKLDIIAERGRIPEATKVYRVVKPWDDLKGDLTDKTITDHGYQATSLSPENVIGMWGAAYAASGDNPMIFEMNLPAGTPAFSPEWVKPSFAHELTLGRDVDMKITGEREETMFVAGLGKEHTFKVLTMDVTPRAKTDTTSAKIAPGLQQRAVDSYRIGGYAAVNRQLRTGQKQKLISMDTDELIKGLDEAMDANVTDEDMYVWRGLNVLPTNSTADLKPGTIIEDKAFLSTTKDRAQAEHFATSPQDINATGVKMPVLMNIKVPAGSKALDFGGGESEVLLDRGAKLKITNVMNGKNGIIMVNAEIVKDDPAPDTDMPAVADIPQQADETKKSLTKKIAAAKEKIAKATAPKQADAPKIESTPTGTKLTAAEEKELTALQNQISELYGQSGYWRMLGAEITHKSGTGKILTKQDIADSTQADNELKKLRDNATPLVERELELRMKRDGDLFGEVDDPNAERWAAKNAPASVMLPGNDPAKIDKIADSYRINDKQTTEHNMSLRSGEPSQAAVSWRSRMKRMINSQQLDKDSVVYRGAALTPERIMQLRPGAVMIDPGSMSTDESRGSAEFYMKTRLGDLPGTLPTLFEIRAPKGMPVADVDYGEFVFDFDTPMRIISTKRDGNGTVNVVAELVPPAEAKALYGAPPVPKASKASSVNLNEGKRGSINAKEAKRIQELSFAKNGIQPWSPPQEIFDQAKKTAHYNNWSVMQVLEAIDAIKPGYKKPVLDWVKTPEGNEYVSKTPTS